MFRAPASAAAAVEVMDGFLFIARWSVARNAPRLGDRRMDGRVGRLLWRLDAGLRWTSYYYSFHHSRQKEKHYDREEERKNEDGARYM